MFVPQILSLILYIFMSSVVCEIGPYRLIPDTARICLATYYRHLENERLLGTWYNVYRFAVYLNLPASAECREFEFKRPSQQDIDKYKTAYNLTGMPYTFKEDAMLYNDTRIAILSGMLLGNREAKFFLSYPRKHSIYRESYDVVLIRYINKNYIVFEQCSMRGNSKWLMSKIKHPKVEELKKVIDSQSDLMSMEKQKYCSNELDPIV